MGRCQDKYFLRLDGIQNMSCLQRHIKQKMLQLPNNPFLRYTICKNKNGFTELLSGESANNPQPWKLFYLSNIPQMTVPKLTLKWATGKTLMVKGPSLCELCFWNTFGIQTSEQSLENVKLLLFVLVFK